MIKFFKQKNKIDGFTRTPKFGVTPKGGGFTLVETLIAISIFSVSIITMMSILGTGISNTNYAKEKMIASYLAQEGIEYVRNKRDYYVLYPVNGNWTNFITFMSTNPTYPSSDSNFTRIISMTQINSNEVKIFSTVSWTQGSGPLSITFSENLFNWVE